MKELVGVLVVGLAGDSGGMVLNLRALSLLGDGVEELDSQFLLEFLSSRCDPGFGFEDGEKGDDIWS